MRYALVAALLGCGCANTAIGRSFTEGLYSGFRVMEAYSGKTILGKDDPKAAECGSPYQRFVGQSLDKVIYCWGQPNTFALGTKGDGYVTYRQGDFNGFQVILKEGVVTDIIKY